MDCMLVMPPGVASMEISTPGTAVSSHRPSRCRECSRWSRSWMCRERGAWCRKMRQNRWKRSRKAQLRPRFRFLRCRPQREEHRQGKQESNQSFHKYVLLLFSNSRFVLLLRANHFFYIRFVERSQAQFFHGQAGRSEILLADQIRRVNQKRRDRRRDAELLPICSTRIIFRGTSSSMKRFGTCTALPETILSCLMGT